MKFNLNKKQVIYFGYSVLFLLVLLEIFFYKSGLFRIALISLKLSVLVQLPGYLIALKLFREEFDEIGLLIIGFSFGLVNSAIFYYLPTLFGANLNNITYIVPIVLLLVGLGLHIGKEGEKNEDKVEEKKEELLSQNKETTSETNN